MSLTGTDKKSRRLRALCVGAGVAAVSTAAYAWWYFNHVCQVPRVYSAKGSDVQKIMAGVANLWKPYRPAFFLPNTHQQTIAGVFRRSIASCFEREEVRLSDGGTCALDWFKDSKDLSRWKDDVPIVIVMHGLTGGSHEGYCHWMCQTAYEGGWRSLVLIYRGCSGLRLTAPKGYCGAVADDVHVVMNLVKKRCPAAPLFCSGYSLGGAMLCKYMSESDAPDGPGSQLLAAAVVSAPVCLAASNKNLSRAWTLPWVFNLVLAYRLRMYAVEHAKCFEGHPTVDDKLVMGGTTIEDFEQATICQVFGFSSLEAYYKAGSPLTHIPELRTKTLILLSEDDPFVGKLPIDECIANPSTGLVVAARGGHVAFLQGVWPFGRSWMESTVMQYFESCLDHWKRKGQP